MVHIKYVQQTEFSSSYRYKQGVRQRLSCLILVRIRNINLDFLKIHRLCNDLIVLWQIFLWWQLEECFTQDSVISKIKMNYIITYFQFTKHPDPVFQLLKVEFLKEKSSPAIWDKRTFLFIVIIQFKTCKLWASQKIPKLYS